MLKHLGPRLFDLIAESTIPVHSGYPTIFYVAKSLKTSGIPFQLQKEYFHPVSENNNRRATASLNDYFLKLSSKKSSPTLLGSVMRLLDLCDTNWITKKPCPSSTLCLQSSQARPKTITHLPRPTDCLFCTTTHQLPPLPPKKV